MTDGDFIQRAMIEHAPIRVQVVRLTKTLADCWAITEYPDSVKRLLAQMMAVTAVLADDIKFDGTVALQARGTGNLSIALAECANQRQLRTIARGKLAAIQHNAPFNMLLPPNSRMALSLIGLDGQVSQAVVAMDAPSLRDCIEHYFQQSVQVPTYLKHTVSETSVTCLCIQRLPDPEAATTMELANWEATWQRALHAFNRADPGGWSSPPVEDLLKSVFARQWIRLLPPRALEFFCACDVDRSRRALKTMSLRETLLVIEEEERIVVTCEFCGRDYTFDEFDVRALHSPDSDNVH